LVPCVFCDAIAAAADAIGELEHELMLMLPLGVADLSNVRAAPLSPSGGGGSRIGRVPLSDQSPACNYYAPFVSLTEESLRTAMGQGITVSFTYDPHWSEQGHAVVARHLAARLRTVGA
jgi:hypothetical protein